MLTAIFRISISKFCWLSAKTGQYLIKNTSPYEGTTMYKKFPAKLCHCGWSRIANLKLHSREIGLSLKSEPLEHFLRWLPNRKQLSILSWLQPPRRSNSLPISNEFRTLRIWIKKNPLISIFSLYWSLDNELRTWNTKSLVSF